MNIADKKNGFNVYADGSIEIGSTRIDEATLKKLLELV